ncbi:hypothetical protein O6H91_01G028100 [Diphasiastrum complanatum]|uniref:Uncharacterized protein n=2 Tax=Diphasiastrum complanatum TaxID=34168 RepID=A0ACC2EPF0_DIPCM|nr:hypothetical protein O6H91_01G028100 [Diphasiastrum complanatum]
MQIHEAMRELFFLAIASLLAVAQSNTDPADTRALQAFFGKIQDTSNSLSNWKGDDPCGNGTNWLGVFCAPDSSNTYHVIELRLLNFNLSGTLAPELGNLSNLEILDVMWNRISGSIPPTLGKLRNLTLLLLNGNELTGELPEELGNLTLMKRIQIDQNYISGPVPRSFANLISAQHFHMNNNSLSGSIPVELGRLLDNNNLSGLLPKELSNISTLNIIQLDNNHFDNATIPSEYGNIPKLLKLSLRNCGLIGSIPDFSGDPNLAYLDLSNNLLSGTIPNSTFPQNITSIDFSSNLLTGEIPPSLGNLVSLQALILQNNKLNGSVNASLAAGKNFSQSGNKLLLDLQQNDFTQLDPNLNTGASNLWLYGTPICQSPPPRLYLICAPSSVSTLSSADSSSNGQVPFCQALACTPGVDELVPALAFQDICRCASPVQVDYRLKSPGFTYFEPYKQEFNKYISQSLNFTLDQVDVARYDWESGPRLRMLLKFFPVVTDQSSRMFNLSEKRRLYQTFTGWKVPDNSDFGPYEVLGFTPSGAVLYPSAPKSSTNLSGGAIAGIILGCVAATAAIVVALMFHLFRKYRRPMFLARRSTTGKQGQELIKVAGVKYFTFDELAVATDGFSDTKEVGQGGYGKVYRGILRDGQIVAIKRAEENSLQGAKEFYTEIELLSRVHHRNLVSLYGYCNDEGEQMLVYEFITGGTLQQRLSRTAKSPLDFVTRLRIAIDSARGILYLHTEANPPIFHRDVKASNILLGERNIAKVADFGLSRLAPVPDLEGSTPGHVSTVVKGTPGYLDPEYFLTHKLSDKSDVYSFGVVLLELLTGMQPISHGKNLVREVNLAYEAGTVLSIVDENMGAYPSEALGPLVQLAIACCKDDPSVRPSMSEVVRDLEDIWNTMPWEDNPSVILEPDNASGLKKGSTVHSSATYSQSNVDESGLFSQTNLNVAPR